MKGQQLMDNCLPFKFIFRTAPLPTQFYCPFLLYTQIHKTKMNIVFLWILDSISNCEKVKFLLMEAIDL